jgi:hypothetical protein
MKLKISAYKPKYSTKVEQMVPGVTPYEVDFFEEMLNIKNGKYKEVIDKVRAISDKKIRDKYKTEHLPALTISAVVKDYRKTENIINHTGLLNIDIDPKGNDHLNTVQDFERLRDTVTQMKPVVCAFLSASGLGLTFVVKINPEQHEDCFRSIEKELKDNLNVSIDTGTGEMLRLRFVSHDPELYLINPDSFESVPNYLPTKEYIASKKKRENKSSTAPSSTVAYDVDFVLKQAEELSLDLTAGYKDWRNIGFALADGLKEEGRDYFHRVSQFHSEYDPKEADLQYDRCLNGSRNGLANSVTIKAFFGIAADAGLDIAPRKRQTPEPRKTTELEEPQDDAVAEYVLSKIKQGVYFSPADFDFVAKKASRNLDAKLRQEVADLYEKNKRLFGYDKKPAIEKIEMYLADKYDFRRNVITQKSEIKLKREAEYSKVNADTIYRDTAKNGYNYPLDKIKSLLRSDFVKDYDPFREYFESLPKWDGVTDHIGELANMVQTTSQEFWVSQFRKALVRSIPCAIAGLENRIVMVLIGEKQNTGKSTFIKFLNPFGNKYYTDEKLKDDKDSIIRLSENFIYNLEELSGARGFEINALKAIISKKAVKQRKAYAEDEEEQPRRCSFWASTNTSQFLTDTENTRWLCFEVESISHDYCNVHTGVQKIDIHKVWSQAYALYKLGTNFQLTAEEADIRDAQNRKYETTTSDYEFIMECIGHKKDYPLLNEELLTASRIGEHVQTMLSASGIRIDLKNVPKALKQLGFTEKRITAEDGTKPRVYSVVLKRAGTVAYEQPPF